MYVDAQQLFSDAQALTGTAVSTNLIDLRSDRDIGRGEPVGVLIQVDVAAKTSDGNETYQFDLQTDDNDSFSTATVLARRIIDKASLTKGSRWLIAVPLDNERYLRLNYTLGGTNPTITVTAFLQPQSMLQTDGQYPDALTIS